MLHVFVDTNIFSKNKLRESAVFRVFSRASCRGEIKLHISEITRREFVTQNEINFDKNIENIWSALADIGKDIPKSGCLKRMQIALEALKAERECFEREFDAWLENNQVQIHSVSEKYLLPMLDSYFKGSAPFSSRKNRKDIPDGLIYLSILETAAELEQLYVLCGDGGLGKACRENIQNAKCYTKWEDFFLSERLKAFRKKTENLSGFVDFLSRSVSDQSSSIAKAIQIGLSQPADEVHPSIFAIDQLSFFRVDEIVSLKLDTEQTKDYGDGLLTIPFSTDCLCSIELYHPPDYGVVFNQFLLSYETESLASASVRLNRTQGTCRYSIQGILGFQIKPEVLDSWDSQKIEDMSVETEIAEVLVEDVLSVTVRK